MQQNDLKPAQTNADKNCTGRIKRKAIQKALNLVVYILVLYIAVRIWFRKDK